MHSITFPQQALITLLCGMVLFTKTTVIIDIIFLKVAVNGHTLKKLTISFKYALNIQLLWTHFRIVHIKNFVQRLGSVYLSNLILQRFIDFLYKAEPMRCGYSTWIGENAVEIAPPKIREKPHTLYIPITYHFSLYHKFT